jgi:hypothetical protein
MRWLNNLILGIPYLFLMKVPYLWLPAVALYTWPPVVSALLTGIILLGLLAMNWQDSAWIEEVRRDFAYHKNNIYIETLRTPAGYVIRNSLLLVVLSVVIGWLLNGRFGLSGLQWGLFACGFTALYKKGPLFGMRVTTIITDRGVSIRFVPGHVDYRIQFRFNEIKSVEMINLPEKIPVRWSVIAPTRKVEKGLLLTAKDTGGFSTQIDQILLSSSDLDILIQKFPANLIRQGN